MEEYKRLLAELAYANEQYEACEKEINYLQQGFQKNVYGLEILQKCKEHESNCCVFVTNCDTLYQEKDIHALEHDINALKIDQNNIRSLLAVTRSREESWKIKISLLESKIL